MKTLAAVCFAVTCLLANGTAFASDPEVRNITLAELLSQEAPPHFTPPTPQDLLIAGPCTVYLNCNCGSGTVAFSCHGTKTCGYGNQSIKCDGQTYTCGYFCDF